MSGLDLLLSQRTFFWMLLVALLIGLALGGAYDALCILRMAARDPAFPRKQRTAAPTADEPSHVRRVSVPVHILRFFCDLLFAVVAAIALILLCYYTNDGQLRAPAIFGMACGFFVYRRLCSPLVLRLADALLHVLFAVIGGLWRRTVGRLFGRMLAGSRRRATDRCLRRLREAAATGFDILQAPKGE